MNDDTRLDNGLAHLTDTLMEGREMDASTGRPDLEDVVRQLHRTLADEQAPDPAYRARLEHRLLQEFERVHRPQPVARRRTFYALAAAAGLALILIAAALAGSSMETGTLQGAAAGEAAVVGAVVVALVFLVAVVIVWRRR